MLLWNIPLQWVAWIGLQTCGRIFIHTVNAQVFNMWILSSGERQAKLKSGGKWQRSRREGQSQEDHRTSISKPVSNPRDPSPWRTLSSERNWHWSQLSNFYSWHRLVKEETRTSSGWSLNVELTAIFCQSTRTVRCILQSSATTCWCTTCWRAT